MCDLTRIGMSELFRFKSPVIFPPEQSCFVTEVQEECFNHSLSISSIMREAMAYGPEAYGDTWLSVVAFDVCRVQVHYMKNQLGFAAERASTSSDINLSLMTNLDILARMVPFNALATTLVSM